jgi:hypothetical protein
MTGGGQEEIELAEVHVRVRSPSASPQPPPPPTPDDPKQQHKPLMDRYDCCLNFTKAMELISDSYRFLETLPAPAHFAVLATCVFLFFGAHNYLQEAISRMEGFEGLGSMLGYLEVVGVMVCSFFERRFVGENVRKVSFYDYMQVLI